MQADPNLPDELAAAQEAPAPAASAAPERTPIPDPALLAGGARAPVDEETFLVEASRAQMRR